MNKERISACEKGIAGFARNAAIMLLGFCNEFLNHYALIIMVLYC
jgi:hypothetical protein